MPTAPGLILGVRSVGTAMREGSVGSEAAAPSLIRATGLFQKLALQASQTILQLAAGGGVGWQELWAPGPALGRFHLLRPFPGQAYSPALSARGRRPQPCARLYPCSLLLHLTFAPSCFTLVGSCVLTGMCS